MEYEDGQQHKLFDSEAILYNETRPNYPDELFHRLIEVTKLNPTAKLLEIGPGTGQATKSLAKKGYYIKGIELGTNLAELARYELQNYHKVEIITGSFEKIQLQEKFDLIYSATAFHWLDANIKFIKCHKLLNPDGYLAIIHTNHVSDENGDLFFHASQNIYDRYYPENVENPFILPKIEELKPPEIDEKLFKLVYFECFPMIVKYSSELYRKLLNTYSPVLELPTDRRNEFLSDIKKLIDENFNGYLDKRFAMSLTVAKKI